MWRFLFVLKVLVTVGLLAWLFSRLDFASLQQQLVQSNLSLLLAGTAVLAVQPLLGALRWWIILKRLNLNLPGAGVVRWTYIGVFVNQVLPATVGGDGLRVWLACRAGGVLGPVVNSVLLDRVAMVLSLVLLMLVCGPWYGASIPQTQFWSGMGLLVAGALAGMAVLLWADRVPVALQRWRVMRWFMSLSGHTRAVFASPRSGSAVMLLSVLSVANLMVSVVFFALAFGATAGPVGMFLVLAPVIAASTLPLSIGGWGTREVAMVALLGLLGVSPETAILASIWLGVASTLTSLPGAFFHFSRDVDVPPATGGATAPEVS